MKSVVGPSSGKGYILETAPPLHQKHSSSFFYSISPSNLAPALSATHAQLKNRLRKTQRPQRPQDPKGPFIYQRSNGKLHATKPQCQQPWANETAVRGTSHLEHRQRELNLALTSIVCYLLTRRQLEKYLKLSQRGNIIAEYVWIDGSGGIRSKSRVRTF